MAQLTQLPAVAPQLWFHGPDPGAVAGPGQGQIQPGQDVLQGQQGLGFLPHNAAESQQHPPLLGPFLALQLGDAIAQANHRLGFDEQGVA